MENNDGRPGGLSQVEPEVSTLRASVPDAVRFAELAKEVSRYVDDLPDADYFLMHARNKETLKPLGKPCHECAVLDGFYSGYSFALAKQPQQVVQKVCAGWFCHVHPTRACRGNIDFVAYLTAQGMSAFGQDGNRLEAKPASPIACDAPKGDNQ